MKTPGHVPEFGNPGKLRMFGFAGQIPEIRNYRKKGDVMGSPLGSHYIQANTAKKNRLLNVSDASETDGTKEDTCTVILRGKDALCH
jgi:hypothetical protein